MILSDTDTARFRELEEILWREDPQGREQVLDGDFKEFCRFGDVYDRDHLLNASTEAVEVVFPFEDFQAEALADDVVLVTYVNTVINGGSAQRARRSSIWVRSDDGWKLRFQQATTLPNH